MEGQYLADLQTMRKLWSFEGFIYKAGNSMTNSRTARFQIFCWNIVHSSVFFFFLYIKIWNNFGNLIWNNRPKKWGRFSWIFLIFGWSENSRSYCFPPLPMSFSTFTKKVVETICSSKVASWFRSIIAHKEGYWLSWKVPEAVSKADSRSPWQSIKHYLSSTFGGFALGSSIA